MERKSEEYLLIFVKMDYSGADPSVLVRSDSHTLLNTPFFFAPFFTLLFPYIIFYFFYFYFSFITLFFSLSFSVYFVFLHIAFSLSVSISFLFLLFFFTLLNHYQFLFFSVSLYFFKLPFPYQFHTFFFQKPIE